jgi:hypothetical protein
VGGCEVPPPKLLRNLLVTKLLSPLCLARRLQGIGAYRADQTIEIRCLLNPIQRCLCGFEALDYGECVRLVGVAR